MFWSVGREVRGVAGRSALVIIHDKISREVSKVPTYRTYLPRVVGRQVHKLSLPKFLLPIFCTINGPTYEICVCRELNFDGKIARQI